MADTYQAIEVRTTSSVLHPLEPLTGEEIAAAVSIVRNERRLSEKVRFGTVTLREPPKEVVLNFKPGNPIVREVAMILLDNADRAVYEATISITEGKVTSWRHVPGVQPSIMLDEFFECEQLLKRDAQFQEALRKRGITNMDLVWLIPGQLATTELKRSRHDV
jgi:primary-amine oxidase